MSAEESDHAAKVKRGMQLSRDHKDGLHVVAEPDCSKCKAEAKQKGKAPTSPVPDAIPEVTLEGVPSMTATQTETITGEVTPPQVTLTTQPPQKSAEEKEREHQAAITAAQEANRESAMTVAPIVAKPNEVSGDKDYDILVHILEDGFTALGTVWYRGQEIGIKRGSNADQLSTDRNGHHWYDRDPANQMEYYGKQMFGLGPWPYQKAPEVSEDQYMAALASGDGTQFARWRSSVKRLPAR